MKYDVLEQFGAKELTVMIRQKGSKVFSIRAQLEIV